MKKRFSGPQIVAKLRQADVLIGQGKNVPEVCKVRIWHTLAHRLFLSKIQGEVKGITLCFIKC